MSAPRRYAHARDLNEKPIFDEFTARGWKVFRREIPVDLLVICPECGRPLLIEVKNADGRDKLTPLQTRLFEFGARVALVYDPGEIPRIVELHRKDCRP